MNSGNPNTLLLDAAARHGLVTAEAAAVLLGVTPNAAAKRLARLVRAGHLERARYVFPRRYWHPYRALGSQALLMKAPVLCFCVFGDPRWLFLYQQGPAAICSAGEERTAVFLDLGGEPDHVTRKLRDFNQLDGLTHFTVLVGTPAKAEKVRRSAANRSLPIPTKIVVIDDLEELLFHAPGNTLDESRLPGSRESIYELPVKPAPGAGERAGHHLLFGLAGGLFGSCLTNLMPVTVAPLLDACGPYAAGGVLLLFVWKFSRHHALVSTAPLRPRDRAEKRREMASATAFALVLLPLMLPTLFWKGLTRFEEIRRAWVSYLQYDSYGVANPGVLRDPGGGRLARVAHFHLAIWLVSSAVLSVPAPGLTELQVRQVAWLVCWPLLLGPPLSVVLLASLTLAATLQDPKEFRSE